MSSSRRLERERRTIAAMLAIYCRDHHGHTDGLCDDCAELLRYARRRLEVCPFQEQKPVCNRCQVHCYSPAMRERVCEVMRYAGPRLVWSAPILSLWHLIDSRRVAPELPGRKRGSARSDAERC